MNEELSGREAVERRVVAALAEPVDAARLQPELERDGTPADPEEGEPEPAALGRPLRHLVVEPPCVRPRGDRRPCRGLPARAFQRIALAHELVQPVAPVGHGELDRTLLGEPAAAAAHVREELRAATAGICLEAAAGRDVRRALDRPLDRPPSGRSAPELPHVVRVEQLEPDRRRAEGKERSHECCAVFGDELELRRLRVDGKPDGAAPTLEREDAREPAVAPQREQIELPGAECIPPGAEPAGPHERRRARPLRQLLPLGRERDEIALQADGVRHGASLMLA